MTEISNDKKPKVAFSKVGTVMVKACHDETSTCPNILIKTLEWKQSILDWLQENDIHERVEKKIGAKKILFHHKMKISISSCPNACSRPQIADIGIVAFVKPYVDPIRCTVCGACVDECIDKAITMGEDAPIFDRALCLGCTKCRDICPSECIRLSEPSVRILVGGKLGRHPHLAEETGTEGSPEEMIHMIDSHLMDYLENARVGERFADYRLRMRKGMRS